MNMNPRIILIILILIALIAISIILISKVVAKEMKYCKRNNDCVPVGCTCSCSGCGGFPYEEIINKKFTKLWYLQHLCKKPTFCLERCCPPRIAVCENNQCIVKEGSPY